MKNFTEIIKTLLRVKRNTFQNLKGNYNDPLIEGRIMGREEAYNDAIKMIEDLEGIEIKEFTIPLSTNNEPNSSN